MALNFNQFAVDANVFLDEYSKKLYLSDDKDKAARILSSILHALREIISTEESLQLIAQFPMFLKAVYVNGWTNKKRRKVKNMVDFIDLIREFNGKTSVNDLESDEVAEVYIHDTFIMLRQYVSKGELDDLRSSLPKDLKNIIAQRMMF
jgi:uncharacterized protein (DUF2267 family)